jgi:hypothetical protein
MVLRHSVIFFERQILGEEEPTAGAGRAGVDDSTIDRDDAYKDSHVGAPFVAGPETLQYLRIG